MADGVNTYATYSTSFKSVGLNLNGVPTDALGRPVLSAATVKPEDVHHVEVGIKTTPFRGVTANVTAYNTDINDFQAQVVNAGVGVLRGYLANAEKVRVRGVEFDGSASLEPAALDLRRRGVHRWPVHLVPRCAAAARGDRWSAGPRTSRDRCCRASRRVPISVGGEYVQRGSVLGRAGQFFTAFDTSYRSSFSSSATASTYLFVDGYSLVNARVGFRAAEGWTLSLWSRNLFNTKYFDLLSAAPGNSGLYVGQPGDDRTFGVTLRLSFKCDNRTRQKAMGGRGLRRS